MRFLAYVLVPIFVLLCNNSNAWAQADAKRIVVLISNDAPPYQEALAGFKNHLEQSGQRVDIQSYPLHNEAANAAPALAQAREQHAALILTLGGLATQSAIGLVSDIPIIAGLVINVDDLHKAPNATGVTLELPLEVEAKWLQRFLPNQKHVGILYNPAQNRARIDMASRLLAAQGLNVYARTVENPSELPAALESLTNNADVLWGIADPLVYTPQTAKPILLFSFRNRIPLVGLSSGWVKAGALYALDRDYMDIGAQCAELAKLVLGGTPVSRVPPTYPRKVVYSVNLKTARHMKVDISPALISGARQVFE